MRRLSHYPTYPIKIYCTKLNILNSILHSGHRGQRMLFTEISADKISVFSLHLCAMCEYMCVQAKGETPWHDLQCLGRDNDGSADSIPPLLPASFEFNHCGSTVVQITLGSSTPSHYPDRNWILEKPRGRAWPANLLLICLWLVWPEPFSGMHIVVHRPCLTWERQEPRWERRRYMLNKDQQLGAFGGHPPVPQGKEWHSTIFSSYTFCVYNKTLSVWLPSAQSLSSVDESYNCVAHYVNTAHTIHCDNLHPYIICLIDLEPHFKQGV